MKKLVSLLLVFLMISSLFACTPQTQTATEPAEATETTETTQEAETTEAAEPAEPQQGVTDTEVLIANSIAVSGAYAPVGIPFQYGMKAYFKMVNDNGGIAGRTINYIHTDDEFSPEKGIAAFEKFFYDDEVFAIVGHFGTPVVSATLDEMKELGIPTVYYATGIGQLYQDKAEGNDRSSFPIQPIYTTEGQVMVAYAKGYFDATTVGVVYTNDDAGKSLFEGIQVAAEKYGVTIVAESIQAGATDASAQVAKVKDCDMVIAAMIQATFPVLIKEMEKQDIMMPVLTTYVNVSKTLTDANAEHVQKLMKTEGAGIYGLGWVDTTDLETEEFVNFYKYMPEVGATESDMNAFAMTGWIAGSVFCQGLERCGTELTWANFIDAMESAPIQNPFGGFVDFSDGQRKGTTEMNLSKMDDTAASGWSLIIPIKSIDDILAGVN